MDNSTSKLGRVRKKDWIKVSKKLFTSNPFFVCSHSLFKNLFTYEEKSVIEATQTMVTQRQ